MQINNWHVPLDEIKFLSKRNNFKLLNIDNKKIILNYMGMNLVIYYLDETF